MNKSITQEAIASNLGICLSWTNLIINGRRNASFGVAKKLSQLTNTSPLIWMEDGHRAERQRAIFEIKLAGIGAAA